MKRYYSLAAFLFVATIGRAGFIPYETLGAPWMDSVVAYSIEKIAEAKFADEHYKGQPYYDLVTGEMLGSHYIVIDLNKWTPNIVNHVFYYERANNPAFYTSTNSEWKTWDSINTYNVRHGTAQNYIPLYNIVLRNFPLALQKDISKVKRDEGRNLFTQLQQINALEPDSFAASREAFEKIIHNISITATNLYSSGPVIIFGSANMLGQYGDKPDMRASFGAYCIKFQGFNTQPSWLSALLNIPKQLCPPITTYDRPSVEEKNFQIATTVQHFIECNEYGNCIMTSGVFQNMYARWLFDNLKNSTVIDKAKLFETCLKVNGLSQEFAWAVLTAEYESGYSQYNQTALGPIYNSYTNGTLDQIQILTAKIHRGQTAFRSQSDIGRDSALYYGWLLYRIPTYMSTIPTAQRIHLIDVLTNAICTDIQGTGESADYNNHCEVVCLSLCINTPRIEERAFLDQLKSEKLIWSLSHRLNNPLFGFFGKANYTDLVFTLSAQWMRAYPEAAQSTQYLTVQWSDNYFNENGAVSTDHDNNTVTLQQKKLIGWMTYPTVSYTVDIYAPVTIRVEEGDWMPGLQGVTYITVPAYFLDWLYHEKMLDDIATTAHIALNVAALTIGIGEVYQATTWGMRIAYGLQVAMTAADWILMDESTKNTIIACFPDTTIGRNVINAYQTISVCVNLTITAKTLVYGISHAEQTFAQGYDAAQSSLSSGLGPTSVKFLALKKLRESIGAIAASTHWLDELEGVLGAGSKYKIQAWIDGGLDATKTEAAFVAATDKVELFNNLEGAKSVYAQRIIVKDLNNVPGISHVPYVNNSLPEQTISANIFGENNAAYDLPSFRAPAFTESAELVTLPENTLLYRVTDEGGEGGAWWTLQPPNSLSEVIGGTAVMPKWNGFSKVVEFKVPPGGIKVWKGKAAAQPISDLPAYQSSTESLIGGSQQIFMNDIIRNDVNFDRYWRDVTNTYKSW